MRPKIGNRFEIDRIIAQRETATMYRGEDTNTGQSVAIKELKKESFVAADADDPQLIRRFDQEFALLQELNHPNIVKLLATIHEPEAHYIVTEYLGGGSLRDWLKNDTQLPIRYILNIALDLTDALIHLHRFKIMHSNIKPTNILFDENGIPHLTDFAGLSYPQNFYSGFYEYLSPEALNGGLIDFQTDIWSLGAVIFEMLVGYMPFQGENRDALRTNMMSQAAPDLSQIRTDMPAGLAMLLVQMLEKDPSKRINSAQRVGIELEAIYRSLALTHDSDRFFLPLPPLRNKVPNNLFSHMMPFIGREADLHKLDQLLNNPSYRLITILGPGGMGKTRLAVEAARNQLNNFFNGVFFVDLVPLTSPDLIITKIAEAIQFSFYRQAEPEPQLLDYLREKNMLLIIDNYEHMMKNTDIVTDILQNSFGIKVLVTSREKLNVREEVIFQIEGLTLPDWKDFDAVMESSVVKLFLQGAHHVKPGFSITSDDLPALAAICRQVEGMPLGILLASSWVESLSLEEVADELVQSFDMLKDQGVDMLPRHKSIRAIFDYSWDLLLDHEREIYSKMAVFRHGFTREVAQVVAGASLMSLSSLVNKSLVRRNSAGRYEIHELLRQYAEEKLAALPATKFAAQTAHCSYYAAFMNKREQHIRGHKHVEAMREIEADFDNIRAAWDFAIEQGLELEIRQLIFTLDRFMALKSMYRQKFDFFQQAVKKLKALETDPKKPSLRIGILLGFLSMCYGDLGDPKKGLETNDQALAILRQYDAPRELALTLTLRNWIVGDPSQTIELLEESLSIFRKLDDKVLMASTLFSLSVALGWQGEYSRSLDAFTESETIGNAIGDPLLIIESGRRKGAAAIAQGNYEEAKEYYQQALNVNQQINNQKGIAECLSFFARIAFLEGDLVTRAWGVSHTQYPHLAGIGLDPILLIKVIIAGVAFGAASLLFVELTHAIKRMASRRIPTPLFRPFVGGLIIIGLTLLVGSQDYLGLSLPLIKSSVDGTGVATFAFLAKIIFTAVTLGMGFMGGEVTPLFVIGSTLGFTLGKLLGVDTGLLASIGFVAVFAASSNTPLACVLMGIELFGGNALLYLALGCFVAYLVSGHRSIYVAQRIGVPKAVGVDVAVNESLEHG